MLTVGGVSHFHLDYLNNHQEEVSRKHSILLFTPTRHIAPTLKVKAAKGVSRSFSSPYLQYPPPKMPRPAFPLTVEFDLVSVCPIWEPLNVDALDA
jgi:hypothetical protein